MGFSLGNLLRQGVQDVQHVFGGAQTPAPQQRQAAAQLPSPGQNQNVFQRIGNTIHNDVIAPVQRDIVMPTTHAFNNVQHAGGNVVNAFSAHNINRVANSNFNPTHLVQQYAVQPGMELGAGIGQNVYNHGVAPIFNLPKQNLTNAFSHSQEAQHIQQLGPAKQAANALQLASNALPGGGKIVDALAGKAAAGITSKLGGNVAAQLAAKTAQTGIKVGGNAAIGGGMGYGLGASNTLLNGGNLAQANQAGLQNAKVGAILGGAGTAAVEAAPHVIQGAKTANAMAHNYGLKPPTNLTPAELSASNKVINGNPMDLTSQDAQLFHQAQTKLVPPDQVGTAHGMNAASDALNAHTAYDMAVKQRAAQVQAATQNLKQGVKQLVPQSEAGSAPLDSPLMPANKLIAGAADKVKGAEPIPPHQAFANEYATALQQMDKSLQGGNKFKANPNGSPVMSEKSPFFRQVFSDTGKAPTTAAYQAEAVRQLESGHGDPYAVQQYNDLKNPETASLLQTAQNGAYGKQPVGETFPIQSTAPTTKPAAEALPAAPKQTSKVAPVANGEGSVASSKSVAPKEPSIYAVTSAKPGQTAAQRQAELDAMVKPGPKTNQNKGAFSKADQTKLSQPTPALTNEQKAELSSKEQVLLHGADTPLRTPEQNRALNPVKSDLQHVPQGNHDLAITQSQMVHNNVEMHGTQVLSAFDKLSKNEQSNFFRSVEKLPSDASPQLKEAVARWNGGTQTVHAHSQSDFLGGNTNFIKNYALHSWDLPADFKDAGKMESLVNGGGKNFQGLNNISRKHMTIAEGEANHLTLNDNPKDVRKQIESYFGASANALRKQALRQGFIEADAGNMEKTGHLNVGVGDTVPLSKQGMKAAKGVQWSPASTNKALVGVRKLNRGATSVLLTHSGVHEANITSRAAPGLALKGHPLAALKAAAGGVRGNVDKGYIDHIRQTALEDGTANKAAMIGVPYSTGHGLLDRQLTPIHNQVVRSVIHDLEKKNIPLTSAEARKAGKAASGMMGEVNYQLAHVSPQHSRLLGDIFLAKQFTPSKLIRVGQAATDTGLGGHYARATIAGNVLVSTAVIAGLGYAFKQKSDNARDALIRGLLAPSVPTPIKDGKGNTQQVRLLGTDTSDVAKILGITMTRNQDGHLGIAWNPKGQLSMNGPAADYLRSRLSPILSDAAKVVSNQNYAGKPLSDPNAPAGTRAIQDATTLLTGHLPIAAQTLAYSKAVKSRLPGSAQTILNANTPKQNVAVNSALGILGGAIANDKTVGQGLQTTQYFNALNKASSGLNSQEKAAMTMVTGSKKNPVTGQYQIAPTADDSRAKATALLSNPKVVDNLIQMNQTLAKQGQKVDPLWLQPKANIVAYYQAQVMPPGDPNKAQWQVDNQTWAVPLATARNNFFSSLPKGDPNKPKSPIQYPTATAAMQNLENQFFAAAPKDQATMIKNNPDLLTQFAKQHDYTNQMRVAQGYHPLKGPPQASDYVNNMMNAIPQGTDPASKKIASNIFKDPQVAAYMQNVSEYNLAKNAALDQFQGNTLNQKALKAANQIGSYDLVKNPDGTLALASGSDSSAIQPGAKGVAYNTYGKSGGSSGSTRSARSAYAKTAANYTGKSNPLKYQSSLRSIAAKASMGKVSTGGSRSYKAKAYKAPTVKMANNLRAKKAFV